MRGLQREIPGQAGNDGFRFARGDGSRLGSKDDCPHGQKDGSRLGSKDGCRHGQKNGFRLGSRDGCRLGVKDGFHLASKDGCRHGRLRSAIWRVKRRRPVPVGRSDAPKGENVRAPGRQRRRFGPSGPRRRGSGCGCGGPGREGPSGPRGDSGARPE